MSSKKSINKGINSVEDSSINIDITLLKITIFPTKY